MTSLSTFSGLFSVIISSSAKCDDSKGSVIVKWHPGWCSPLLSAWIVPWCNSTNERVRFRPIPVPMAAPLLSCLDWKNRSKIFSLSASISPLPVSRTTIWADWVVCVNSITTSPPSGVNLNALDNKLKIILSKLDGSIHSFNCSISEWTKRNLMFFRVDSWMKFSQTSSIKDTISVCLNSKCICPFSILRTSNSWFTRLSIRCAFLYIRL